MIKDYLIAGGTALAVGLIAFGLHSYSVNSLEKKHAAAILALETSINAQCSAAKDITERVSYDYQNDLLGLGAELDNFNSLYGLAGKGSISGEGAATGGYNDPARAGFPTSEAGQRLERQRVAGIVAEGERYRRQLKACQAFIKADQDRALK